MPASLAQRSTRIILEQQLEKVSVQQLSRHRQPRAPWLYEGVGVADLTWPYPFEGMAR